MTVGIAPPRSWNPRSGLPRGSYTCVSRIAWAETSPCSDRRRPNRDGRTKPLQRLAARADMDRMDIQAGTEAPLVTAEDRGGGRAGRRRGRWTTRSAGRGVVLAVVF